MRREETEEGSVTKRSEGIVEKGEERVSESRRKENTVELLRK